MPVRMVEVHVSIDSLMPLSTAAPPETCCFLSFEPNPKEVEAKDSEMLSKATRLRFCDEVIEDGKEAEGGRGGVESGGMSSSESCIALCVTGGPILPLACGGPATPVVCCEGRNA